jgi:ring-1,2-phenylacetyl-CoA epoxidase subunit PaaD
MSDLSNEGAHTIAGLVRDPELGEVTIGDLGLVRSAVVVADADGALAVTVELTPTFLGCPAIATIERDVSMALKAAGADTVAVRWSTLPWDETQVSALGRERLSAMNIAVGDDSCPRCGNGPLRSLGANSSTSCRSLARCETCHDIVDVLRSASHPMRFGSVVPMAVSIRPSSRRPESSNRPEATYAHL